MYKYYDRKYVTNIWNLQRVDHIYLYSIDFTSISMEYGNYKTVLYLFITALLVLIIGWINFINHSAARMPERANEIGIRKTVGASKKQLIKQLVTESFLINFIAFIISLAIVESSLNWLNSFLRNKYILISGSQQLVLGSLDIAVIHRDFAYVYFPGIVAFCYTRNFCNK